MKDEAFHYAWQAWLYATDTMKTDRDAALKMAIEAYLYHADHYAPELVLDTRADERNSGVDEVALRNKIMEELVKDANVGDITRSCTLRKRFIEIAVQVLRPYLTTQPHTFTDCPYSKLMSAIVQSYKVDYENRIVNVSVEAFEKALLPYVVSLPTQPQANREVVEFLSEDKAMAIAMKATHGTANPKWMREAVRALLATLQPATATMKEGE